MLGDMVQVASPPRATFERATFEAVVVVGWSIAAAFAALVAWVLVTETAQAALGARGELVEGMPVLSMWFLSVVFALVGVAGGGVCLGLSTRVRGPRAGRIGAYTVSGLTLGCSIAALAAGFVAFSL